MSKPVYRWCVKDNNGQFWWHTLSKTKKEILEKWAPLEKGESIVHIRVEEVPEKGKGE